MLASVLALTLCLQWLTWSEAAIQCLDSKGKKVDWFIVYKLPRLDDSPDPLVREGLGHLYLDVNQQDWQRSTVSLNDSDHAIAYTLQQIYDSDKSQAVFYALYNDERPDGGKTMSHGHTKGSAAFDSVSGFWLVHSLPKFPRPAAQGYTYPHNGLVYGQAFLCISLPTSSLDEIGQQFLYNYPWIYDYNLPASFASKFPHMESAIKRKHVTAAPFWRVTSLPTLNSEKFISFAKFTDFDADLYDRLVAPYYKTALLTETWQNGASKSPSNCSAAYRVMNIRALNISGEPFKETHDHSKWAVTTNLDSSVSGQPWVCIGDINRMESQKERAGGTVCARLPKVWFAFQRAITDVDRCR